MRDKISGEPQVGSLLDGSDLAVDDICFICWDDGIEAGVFRGIETLPKSGWKHAVVFTREYGCRRIELCNVFKNYEDAKADWMKVKRRQLEILQSALNPNDQNQRRA